MTCGGSVSGSIALLRDTGSSSSGPILASVRSGCNDKVLTI
jgi:hypothetical protein